MDDAYGAEFQAETTKTKQLLRAAEIGTLRSILGYYMGG